MRFQMLLLFILIASAKCLMLQNFYIPKIKLCNRDALLKCEYDLGSDRLYAVKWYKNDEMFYRYMPSSNPLTKVHLVEGVKVDESNSSDTRVQLRSLTMKSTGVYRCVVSADAPSFAVVAGKGGMTVVQLPKQPPEIDGELRDKYEVDDVVNLNCISGKSFPPTKLSWYINDSPVDASSPISVNPAPEETVTSQSALMITSLRLQLQLRQQHFIGIGPIYIAKVRCVARMSPLFWQGEVGENSFELPTSEHKDDVGNMTMTEVISEGFGYEEDREGYQDNDDLYISRYRKEAFVLVRGSCSAPEMSRLMVYGSPIVNTIFAWIIMGF